MMDLIKDNDDQTLVFDLGSYKWNQLDLIKDIMINN